MDNRQEQRIDRARDIAIDALNKWYELRDSGEGERLLATAMHDVISALRLGA